MTSVLSVAGLRKEYGPVLAVDGVSIEVGAGEVVGLLGPNGAGKTTTLECIEGLRRPDAGRVTLRRGASDTPAAIDRERHLVMGVQLQSGALPADMTAWEAMRLFCAYHGVPPRSDLLDRFGLGNQRDRRYGGLSVGNQRRLALALAIAHRPALVLLDEPTAGLDVASRAELHHTVRELASGGAAVLLATHDMAEAEKLADRVCILLHGRIVAQGTPREITATGSGTTKVSISTEGGSFVGGQIRLTAAALRDTSEGYAVYFSTDPAATVAALLAELSARGDRIVDLRVERPSLEERFLEITAGESR
jgi:ABC-2 type transport system ATP-binding protein